jgi:hypothetical protein
MNQPKKVVPSVTVATTKITKKEVDAALAAGNTHAKFKNKGVQKRLIKNQEKIRRQQALREQQINRANKDRARMQKAQDTLASAGKAEAVVNEGVAALTNLISATSESSKTALAEIVDAKADAAAAVLGLPAGTLRSGEVPSTTEIDPASIGGDLVDVDHDPKNFDVQSVSQEVEGDTFLVKISEDSNKYPLNVYGDEQKYKPLPEVGDMIRPDGIVAVFRKAEGDVPSEEQRTALGWADINYIFDTIYYAPRGKVIEVSDDGILVQKEPVGSPDFKQEPNQHFSAIIDEVSSLNPWNACVDPSRKQMFGNNLGQEIADNSVADTYPEKLDTHFPEGTINPEQLEQMNIRGHALDIDIAASYEKPELHHPAAKEQLQAMFGGSLHPSQAEVGSFITEPKSEPNGLPVKVQNSGISGAFLEKAAFNADLPEATSPMSPLFHSTAHSTLTAACRAEHVFDPLLLQTASQSDPVDPAATDEVNRTIGGSDAE